MAKPDDLWDGLVRKQPDLADPGATVSITSANLKLLVVQVYAIGRKDGAVLQSAVEKAVGACRFEGEDAIRSVFDVIFGR